MFFCLEIDSALLVMQPVMNQLRRVLNFQLAQNVFPMFAYREVTDAQSLGNHLAGIAFDNQLNDGDFTVRQPRLYARRAGSAFGCGVACVKA